MRSLTRTQRLLCVASAFGVGGMLQAFVILYIGTFLQSGLSNFVVAMISR
jgi:Na+-transporting NADH:ubiquinone oxidoreductase subunit NqrD